MMTYIDCLYLNFDPLCDPNDVDGFELFKLSHYVDQPLLRDYAINVINLKVNKGDLGLLRKLNRMYVDWDLEEMISVLENY